MRTRDELLHRLHDHELDGPAPALDAEDRVRLDAMADLGQLLRNTVAAESAGPARIDVWAGIERRIARPSGESDIERAARRKRLGRRVLMALPLVAAVAASVVLWIGAGRARATNGCDVEVLDVSGAAAAVIQVPDRDGPGTTTVIWTTEEDR